MLRIRFNARATICALFGLAMIAGTSAAAKADPNPASPQPAASAVKPGLAVRYWPYPMHWIGDVERVLHSGGNKGTPLPGLNYDDNTGPVLSSNLKQEIAAEITGFIKFPQDGEYQIMAVSNDGVRVTIGGTKVTEDPGIHAMENSPIGKVAVKGGVWYPLQVLYFQRHGTWGLQLMWAPAGQDPKIVPNDAYGHVEG